METSHTLASLRVRAGMTTQSAAPALGIGRSTLLKYEADASKIPADLLARAAELYAVPVTAIFTGDARKLAGDIRASATAEPAC